jgi:hypothetical protein
VNIKELTIEWCPMKQMVADFMTKPIHGSHFRHLRDYIWGEFVAANPRWRQSTLIRRSTTRRRR